MLHICIRKYILAVYSGDEGGILKRHGDIHRKDLENSTEQLKIGAATPKG